MNFLKVWWLVLKGWAKVATNTESPGEAIVAQIMGLAAVVGFAFFCLMVFRIVPNPIVWFLTER